MSESGFVWSVLPEWYFGHEFCVGDSVPIEIGGKEHIFVITRVDADRTIYCDPIEDI